MDEPLEQERQEQDERTDFDGFWKEIIDEFAVDLIGRMIPELYDAMDLTKNVESLNKELHDVLGSVIPHQPTRFVDELLRVYLKDGTEREVLLHIEIQGEGGENISFRMAHYCSLIFGNRKQLPVALLILTAPRNETPADRFQSEHFGTGLVYYYNCVDIRTLDEQELLNSDKPIDLMLCAVKRVMRLNKRSNKTKRNQLKADCFKELARILAAKGWDEQRAGFCMRLMFYVFNLPKVFQADVVHTLHEEGKKMPYMNLWEQRGYDRGYDRGVIDDRNEMIDGFLREGVNAEVVAKVTGKTLDYINSRLQILGTVQPN